MKSTHSLPWLLVLEAALVLGGASGAAGAPGRAAQPAPRAAPPPAPPTAPRATPKPAPRAAPRPAPRPRITYPKLVKFVPAPYPESARRAGREGVVVMHVTVAADGSVIQVAVVKSAGADLDQAAVAAVKQFRYRPATVDGKPVTAKVQVAYPFRLRRPPTPRVPPTRIGPRRIPPRRPPSKVRVSPRRPPARATTDVRAVATQGEAMLAGTLHEKGTRKRLEDAEVVVFKTRAGPAGKSLRGPRVARTHADEQGRFSLRLPPGSYLVEVRAPGCFRFKVTERLAPGDRLEVAYYVERRSYDPYQTVVIGKAERREVTRHRVPITVIEKIPGTQGDALRAVQNMPGVARAPFSLGFLIVRGSAPRDTRVFLEGHTIPHLYHFMGLSSVFNSDLLRQIDFIPGNFSVQYGRATGGIVDVITRSPKTDRWHGYASADMWGLAALAEGPVGKGSLALSLRRTHIDAIFALIPDIALTAASYDYVAMLDYPLGGGHLKVIAFGADDRLKRRIEDTDQFETVHVSLFAKALALWSRRWGRTRLKVSLAGGYTRQETGADARGEAVQDTGRVSWRLHLSRQVSKGLTTAVGLDGEYARVKVSTVGSGLSLDLLENEDANTDLTDALAFHTNFFHQALYLEATWQPHRRVSLVPGLRLDAIRDGAFSGLSFDPRLTAKVDLLPKKLALTAGVGLFHQEPEVEDRFAIVGGNPRLWFERALHASLGVAWQIRNSLSLEVTGFYKHLWNVVSDSEEWIYREPDITPEMKANHGLGRVYGAEILLQKKPDNDCPKFLRLEKCFGWIGYTVLRSERRSEPGAPWRLFEDDQTHLLTLLLQGAWAGGWELGIRFRLASGTPAEFYSGGLYDADKNDYIAASGTLRWGRMPLFHQLDIRVDKRFVFRRWMLSLYLDIQNVYYYQHSEFLQYNFNYTQRGMLKGLPIVPSLGLKGEF